MLMPYFPKVTDGPLATHTSTIQAEDSHKIRPIILLMRAVNFGMMKPLEKYESLTIYLGIWHHATTAPAPFRRQISEHFVPSMPLFSLNLPSCKPHERVISLPSRTRIKPMLLHPTYVNMFHIIFTNFHCKHKPYYLLETSIHNFFSKTT